MVRFSNVHRDSPSLCPSHRTYRVIRGHFWGSITQLLRVKRVGLLLLQKTCILPNEGKMTNDWAQSHITKSAVNGAFLGLNECEVIKSGMFQTIYRGMSCWQLIDLLPYPLHVQCSFESSCAKLSVSQNVPIPKDCRKNMLQFLWITAHNPI